MVLIANDNLIVYTDGGDRSVHQHERQSCCTQNQTNIDSVIGTANYDIGHVFTTGGGGVAGLGVVCRPASKARGVTGLLQPDRRRLRRRLRRARDGPPVRRQPHVQRHDADCGGGNRNAIDGLRAGQRLDDHGLRRHLRRRGPAAAQRRLLPHQELRRDRDLHHRRHRQLLRRVDGDRQHARR